MPTYEYRCPAGHVFEKFFSSMHDRRHEKCPTCGQQAERLISGGAGLVFRGSGFYITDYKRAGEKAEQSGGDTKPADSKPADSKPAESKPGDTARKKKNSSGDK
jgi:putative FmdB family regulatory protein